MKISVYQNKNFRFSSSIFSKKKRKNILEPWIVKFGVKLYPPVVSDLIEEITRFYIYQQLREDVAKGILLSLWVIFHFCENLL